MNATVCMQALGYKSINMIGVPTPSLKIILGIPLSFVNFFFVFHVEIQVFCWQCLFSGLGKKSGWIQNEVIHWPATERKIQNKEKLNLKLLL